MDLPYLAPQPVLTSFPEHPNLLPGVPEGQTLIYGGRGPETLDSNQLREVLGVNKEAKRTVPSLLEKKPKKRVG